MRSQHRKGMVRKRAIVMRPRPRIIMGPRTALITLTAIAVLMLAMSLAPKQVLAQAQPRMQFRTERIIDTQQGGLVLATISVPLQWRVNSQVLWNYQDVSHPVRTFV